MIRIFRILLIAVLAVSCYRRPLAIGDNNVLVNISIDREIVNYTLEKDPSMMRVMFFDVVTGHFASQSFHPASGGMTNVIPGRYYNVLVYNFDTENIVINAEYEWSLIHATTNDVPETYRRKLKSRADKHTDERIVFEPDHNFVGSLENIYIPARGADKPPVELNINASTIVETWKVNISSIYGVEWVSSISGVISGLAISNSIAYDLDSEEKASVFFETMSLDSDGNLSIVFNTFGRVPSAEQVLTLVITDLAGQGHEYNINVTKEFIDNPEQVINIVTDRIIIEKPETSEGNGGLKPDVDDWENIETDIII